MDMTKANSSIILVLETNYDWLGIVRVVMGFVEMSTFDLGHFHVRVLDDIDKLDFSRDSIYFNYAPRFLGFRRNL